MHFAVDSGGSFFYALRLPPRHAAGRRRGDRAQRRGCGKVGDSTMLHLVKAIDVDRRVVETSGNSATLGWTAFDRVFGIGARIGVAPVPGACSKTKR